MAEEMSDANPLEEAAADLSADLERERVNVKDSAFANVRGGHVFHDPIRGPHGRCTGIEHDRFCGRVRYDEIARYA